jgi:Lon protease-like protein
MAPQLIPLPQSFDGQTRLFPLSDLVFFPSTVLPLHIFESRYCEMLEDALQGDQLISMATLLPGFEHDYHCRPPIAPVVCIGRLASCRKTNSGTYDLMLIGLRRARVEHEINPVRSFRRARVSLIEDRVATSDKVTEEFGKALTDRILQSIPSARQMVDEFRRRRISLATLTDVAAFHLPLPIKLKLQLLGESDVLVRSQLLLASLPPSLPSQNIGNPSYPADFSDN